MLQSLPSPAASPPAPAIACLCAAAVATAFPWATKAGLDVLRDGGNAVDAAVAAAWALSVCEPAASGLGGQTTLLIRFADGRAEVVDGHSVAPAAASTSTIGPSQQRRGHRACTVPSTPATLDWVHRRHGALSRERVMAPAVQLAEDGYALTPLQCRQTRWVADALRSGAGGAAFLHDGAAPQAGHRLRQPRLAATLRRLALAGVEDFYQGGIARLIVADMQHYSGLITAEDLALHGPPAALAPLTAQYRDHTVMAVPPPGGGLTLLQALKLLQQLMPASDAASDDDWCEAAALTTSAVFRARERDLLAPEDLSPGLLDHLLSDAYVGALAAGIDDPAEGGALANDAAEEPGDTTHLTTSDRDGNVVMLTQSIQSVFGAKVAHPGLGFLYNNYLATCPRGPHPFGLQSRCRPRSNAAPTLVLHDGRPVLALGAAGSRRILSSILWVVAGVIDRGRGVHEAVAAPRVHGLMHRKVWLERAAASDALLSRLQARGRKTVVKPPCHYSMGSVQALQFLRDGHVVGAADPRRDGTAGTLDSGEV
jgi:gamma-glutamyltranspeptidase / glutathione hydrolase